MVSHTLVEAIVTKRNKHLLVLWNYIAISFLFFLFF